MSLANRFDQARPSPRQQMARFACRDQGKLICTLADLNQGVIVGTRAIASVAEAPRNVCSVANFWNSGSVVMAKSDNATDKEPDWLDPANDRKTPYTEAEIELFVDDFIRGLDVSEWEKIKSEYGEENARERFRAAMRSMDANNLANMTPIGSIN